ncbi:MAG: AraC family transcriptional regulator [Sphaerochaeta sp.]|jgi:AraC-like DNA-binding protein|nr:AraC family transcriptional regulator [Sphaerochaeta sp.]
MKLTEKGVLDTSEIFLYNGNTKANEYFYHMLCTGHYYCDSNYFMKKNTLDSFLLMYVRKGKGFIIQNDIRTEVHEGALIFLNVYTRPSYGTESSWEILWSHFDGLSIKQLYQDIDIIVQYPVIRKTIENAFNKILVPFENGSQPGPAIINKYLTLLITEFFEQDEEQVISYQKNRFQKVFDFINKNIEKPIALETLAKEANLSMYYFIRSFKAETGQTPHEYIITTRVNAAQFYLSATQLTLKDITYRCGFSNESAFNNTFKRIVGKTPLGYRNEVK